MIGDRALVNRDFSRVIKYLLYTSRFFDSNIYRERAWQQFLLKKCRKRSRVRIERNERVGGGKKDKDSINL